MASAFFRSETGVALNNTGGDDVRLVAPDGQQAQIFHFTTAGDDQAWSVLPDGSDTWVDSVPPSPGASNQPTLGPVTVSGAWLTVASLATPRSHWAASPCSCGPARPSTPGPLVPTA